MQRKIGYAYLRTNVRPANLRDVNDNVIDVRLYIANNTLMTGGRGRKKRRSL